MDRLQESITNGNVVLVVGSGVSTATTKGSATANWPGLITSGITRARTVAPVTQTWEDTARQLLTLGLGEGDTDSLIRAASMVAGALKQVGTQAFANWLNDDIGNLQIADPTLSEALGALRLPILTTNYDTLLENSLGRASAVWTRSRELQQLITADTSDIGHLHGVWSEPDSVVLSEEDYFHLAQTDALQGIQRAVSAIKSIVYVGFGDGLADPNFGRLLEWHRVTLSPSGVEHYRLCTEAEYDALLREHASDNITPLIYGAGHDDLPGFLHGYVATVATAALAPSGIIRNSAAEAQQNMASILVADSVIAETLADTAIGVETALLPPILLPVPHAEFVRARTSAKGHAEIQRLNPETETQESDLVLLVGDDESGLTTAVRWMAWKAALNLGNVAPLYVNFRQCGRGAQPLADQLSNAARFCGLISGKGDPLPPFVLGLDDFSARVSHVSELVVAKLAKREAFFTVVGCKQGHEDEATEMLRAAGLQPRVRYIGRLADSDVEALARVMSPYASHALTKSVLLVLKSENLPRTPFSVSLLMSILARGGMLASSSSQTMVLDQYVSTLLGRGDPHEDARYVVDQAAREALLCGLAQSFVEASTSGMSEHDTVNVLNTIIQRLGWSESPVQVLYELLRRRVLRRAGGHVVFSRSSYLYLFAAKRTGTSPAFRDFVADRPLFYAPILKGHAALNRRDAGLLEGLSNLLQQGVAFSAATTAPYRLLELVDPPIPRPDSLEVQDSGPDSDDVVDTEVEVRRPMSNSAVDDSDRPAFPGDDPAEMPFAMRLIRILDLVSTVLRDSDQIEDLALKKRVLVDTLKSWGTLIGALSEDTSFAEYSRGLAEELLREFPDVPRRMDYDDFVEEFIAMIPGAMAAGGIDATLASRKLIAAFKSALEEGSLDANEEVAIGAAFFAYTLKEPGWPTDVQRLMPQLENRWIIRHFFLFLLVDAYTNGTTSVDDMDALLEVCVAIVGGSTRYKSDHEKKSHLDRVRADLRARRLRGRTRLATKAVATP